NKLFGLEGNKGRLVEDKKSLIPLKRSRDGEQSNRASSITGSSGRKLIVRKDKISEVDLGHKTTNSSQDKKALTNGNMGCKSHQKGSSSSQCARSLNTALFRDQCT
ncbi:hypothetical protein SDJN02_08252, partial [Cucurbita argyrosperma subsp. argyrosperma]